MDSAVPRDHFRASLLLVLGQAPVHGYDLPALLAPLGLGGIDRGFLYRSLRLMEADDLVSSEWDASPAGPARRIYRVTPLGRAWMAVAADSLRDADRLMASWLTRYRRLLRAGGPRAVPGVSAAS
ncbi:MAG TPA: helix-turn-helix transcriptional regulator [Acidimicrobiales bacterium]|jgi:PadR family transcriptional regulator PadR|nr:helix-turn-helix transcriptional regulator [Acidimicrobiales bacterium]